MLVEGQLSALKRSMVQFARPRKFAPDARMAAANAAGGRGMRMGHEGLGDGTPIFAGDGNIAVGPRGQRQQNGGGRRGQGGGYGGQGGGYTGYDSQRSTGHSGSQNDYITQQSFGSMSLGETQPPYSSQLSSQLGYDSQQGYGCGGGPDSQYSFSQDSSAQGYGFSAASQDDYRYDGWGGGFETQAGYDSQVYGSQPTLGSQSQQTQ